MDVATKIEETFFAPVGSELRAQDTQVIERDGWYQVITPSTGTTQGNEVVYSRLAPGEAEAVVQRTISEYAAHGVPFRWSTGPLTEPVDLGHLLERLGFVGWSVLGMAVEPSRWHYRIGSEVEVERVTEANLAEYYGCYVRGWELDVPDPGAWRADHLRALATGRFELFLARVVGEPVGTAGFIAKERSAYLVGGNVLPSHRGRGVYRALLDARMRAIAGRDLPLAVTHAREATSSPILAKLGFESLYCAYMYRWEH